MHLIEFKICMAACNGSRVVVSHQIFSNFLHLMLLLYKMITNHQSSSKIQPGATYNCLKLVVSIYCGQSQHFNRRAQQCCDAIG